MLSDAELESVLSVGQETRAVEFKRSGSLEDGDYVALVARAALAFANQRDGGQIILGIVDSSAMGEENGLNESQLEDWSDIDKVTDKINRYADPPLQLTVGKRNHPNGRGVVIIEVREFAEIPSLCARDFGSKLKLGQLYTRSLRKPESSQYHTQNEMREVLDLATQKGLRRFVETVGRAGLNLAAAASSQPTEQQLYREQLDSIPAHLSTFDSAAPHFVHIIHPSSFSPDRIAYTELQQKVAGSTVSKRGWPFPFSREPERGQDLIWEENGRMHPEAWAFFTTGLFADLRSIGEWQNDWDSLTIDDERGITGNMPVWLPLCNFTEAIEFAVRLRAAMALDEPMAIRFEGKHLTGRRLVVADRGRSGFHSNYVYSAAEWSSNPILLDDTTAVAGTRQFAVEATKELVHRFGWTAVTDDLLSSIQDQVFGPE
ncbi:hypothetical protein D477_007948 [Arthrobacter crystallopoietes BAB-32]|uniref:Schlafen AlbA-2 domain-containing protein n=1 Tax=Arthrobacter crystallopoietes BAB-32 TaxID=1246476 RepID=N1V940_9MICC|nr:RNA-binding domain-containing protein [Arthrobacter crystallopoietes]EMY34768.1 hypothetical protein D477_007948 [Arthrobacter crystallopoietes BAB-32]